ncbi:MAG: hypothetical protein ONB46_25245 [candidate division KSB1 bacterium]|nr:hypothetical protein [candidate division KSB1 bacterium]MDZ7369214.1 hypothetical protein [candidate division KSB1 bacterium]MDZ7407208.1 hypothetical protein [candidate division KSB1 bacterium]
MHSNSRLKLLRNLGRLTVLLGIGIAFYNWFDQSASLISPVVFVLMIAGVLIVATAELINWMKTGSLKL